MIGIVVALVGVVIAAGVLLVGPARERERADDRASAPARGTPVTPLAPLPDDLDLQVWAGRTTGLTGVPARALIAYGTAERAQRAATPDAGSDIRARERIDTAERQEHRWEELKRAEKQRDSSVDGVPLGQPAVALAAKLISRTTRAGLPADLLPGGADTGSRLFADAARAKLAGDDPEAALRIAARRFAHDVRAAERSARDAGLDPHALDADAWRAHWPKLQ